jgi:hypothetical protein
MTNRFKDFGKGGDLAVEPLSFKLHEEEFHCWPNLQGSVLLELAAGTSEQDNASTVRTMTDFFDSALLPESLERFNALLKHKEKIVSIETLAEITSWLVEEYSARPTKESSGS